MVKVGVFFCGHLLGSTLFLPLIAKKGLLLQIPLTKHHVEIVKGSFPDRPRPISSIS